MLLFMTGNHLVKLILQGFIKKKKQYVTLETHKYLRVSYFYLKQTEGTFRIIVKNTLNMIMHTYFSNLFTQVSHGN